MRYFFHTFEDGARSVDTEGTEFDSDEAAKNEATRYLAEMALDATHGQSIHRFGVEVSDEVGAVVAAVGFALDEGPEVGSLAHQLARKRDIREDDK